MKNVQLCIIDYAGLSADLKMLRDVKISTTAAQVEDNAKVLYTP